ncbi:MAG TPA: hypothetical protein VGL13_02440 [Polyangiaceae bacterium]|jgi:hypothetical protein
MRLAGFAPAVAADFGFDGVDLDYEPANPDRTNASGHVVCAASDEQ